GAARSLRRNWPVPAARSTAGPGCDDLSAGQGPASLRCVERAARPERLPLQQPIHRPPRATGAGGGCVRVDAVRASAAAVREEHGEGVDGETVAGGGVAEGGGHGAVRLVSAMNGRSGTAANRGLLRQKADDP